MSPYDLSTPQGFGGYSQSPLLPSLDSSFASYMQPTQPSFESLRMPNPGSWGPSGAITAAAAPPAAGGWFDGFLSTPTQQGWGAPALGALSGAFNAWMGMKQYGLAKDQLAEGKRQFSLNYDAQRKTTNSALEDRQRARVSSNPTAYQSVGDYMTKYGIQGGG